MNHNQLNSNGNYQQEPKSVDFAELATSMLENEEIKKLPEAEQGPFIVDQLLGRIVAAGPVESGAGQKSPLDLIRDMQDYAKYARGAGADKARTLVTRKNGMRGMVDALSADGRIGPLWGNLESRVAAYGTNDVAFSSLPMMSGYLEAIYDANTELTGSGWKDALLKEVNDYAMSDGRARWQADDLLSSDVEPVRRRQQEWQRNVQDAQTAGVDMNVVTRGAERLRTQRRAGEDLGSRAVGIMVTNPYDKFYE